jgi:hypothetical protein
MPHRAHPPLGLGTPPGPGELELCALNLAASSDALTKR